MTKQRLFLLSVTTAGLGLLATIVCRFLPLGIFDSTTLVGTHAADDVLHFRAGKVTWRTCCGDLDFGTYRRLPNGRWEWSVVLGKKQPRTNTYLIRPGLLSLTCEETGGGTNVWKLTRRLLPPGKFDHAH